MVEFCLPFCLREMCKGEILRQERETRIIENCHTKRRAIEMQSFWNFWSELILILVQIAWKQISPIVGIYDLKQTKTRDIFTSGKKSFIHMNMIWKLIKSHDIVVLSTRHNENSACSTVHDIGKIKFSLDKYTHTHPATIY